MRQYYLRPTISRRPFEGAEFMVRIANDLRKATVFLGEEIADDKGQSAIDPRATGFFVAWQSDSGRPIEDMKPEQAGIYLVTARHVAKPLGTHFAIRFNKKGGGSDIEPIEGARWTFHSDETVDVAVLHCGYPDWADCVPVPGRLLAKPTAEDTLVSTAKEGEPLFNDPNLGIGDIAYVVGLFHLLQGKKVNLPVVHTGHIALLPDDEKIPAVNRITGKMQEVEGYLVEAHGLEGLSGAPVFARSSTLVTAKYLYTGPPLQGGIRPEHPVPGRLHGLTVLLGLWSASWESNPSEELAKDRKLDPHEKVPLGIGIVVPAEKIAETLNKRELVMARQKEYERRLRERAATTESLSPSETSPPASDANPMHREDFMRLVDAAARKPPQED
jgi:hypothetical protein